jgi:hypothetical protein
VRRLLGRELWTCGVPGHPKLTAEEQALPQFWDGGELIREILPETRITFSNVDRILHKKYPHNRLVLFEHKHEGEVMSGGQRILHEAFQEPTTAEVLHVVYSERHQMRPAIEWALEQSVAGINRGRGQATGQ